MWEIIIYYAITAVASYLLGAVPFSFLIGKIFAGIDICDMGSGNPGATNLYRNAGPAYGLPALVLDIAKGLVPAILLPLNFGEHHLVYVAGACAVAGHMYTVFLGFKGGKGVATALGVMVVISWEITFIALGVFVLTVIIFRYVSLGSVLAAVSIIVVSIIFPVFGIGGYDWVLSLFCGVFGLLVIFAHRKNIKRLLRGEEGKFSPGKKGKTEGGR
ncbi:MAG: glycerol-3-phosphate 1-O-acyltransferase PlsY [bacterium]|nr:glycerol-3-phosphate 1-O-acyltransferase PlsY [bacterium]